MVFLLATRYSLLATFPLLFVRKRIWQLHSFLGLFAGFGLLLIGLSGSLLVFHDELEWLLNPAATRVTPAETGRLSFDELLARANAQLPDYEITGWQPRDNGARNADALYLIRHGDTEWKTATLDPYTGKILASPISQHRTLTGWLLKFHYEFFADEIGRALCALLALALLVLGVSGIFIYRQIWKNLFTLRWSHAARVLLSDFHKLIGITSAAFNLVLGFTGAYWNITEVIEHAGGHEHAQPAFATRLYPETLALDALLADAPKHMAGFRPNFISLPSVPAAPAVMFWGSVPGANPFRNPYGSTVTYDAKTAAPFTPTATRDIREQPLWTQITDMFQPLHFGSFGGLFIKIIWSLAGLAPGALAVTGFLIWRSRKCRS